VPTHRFPIRSSFIALCLALTAACGAGGGTERELPAGPPTSAPPGDFVLYASYGQSNMVAAFRLGTDGFLPSAPFSTMAIMEPRTILVSNGILYVGTTDRVASATILADGSLPSLPTAVSGIVEDGDVNALLVVDDILYAAYSEAERLITYQLEFGQVSAGILSASGETSSDYLVMAEANGYIYAHAPGLGRIDTFPILPDGTLDELPEPQLPEVDLFGCEVMKVRDGKIYAGESSRDRLTQYDITSVGLPEGLDEGADPISNTRRSERYVDFVFDGNLIHAAGFNAGRIDTYEIDPTDGTLPEQGPVSRTEQDTSLFPAAVLLHDGMLYVAQGGRDRIDGYRIGANGYPLGFPSTSTDPIEPGFPNDLELAEFPP
jgi:hypothetical protein